MFTKWFSTLKTLLRFGVALALSINGGLALADLAYRAKALAETLAAEAGLLLLTPASAGENRAQRALISGVRERVETTFSALVDEILRRQGAAPR